MKKNLYLFSPHTQSFFMKQEGKRYSRAHLVERRLRELTHRADEKRDFLSAVIYANLTYNAIQDYINDLRSEITKFAGVIQDPAAIKTMRKTLTGKTHPFSDLTPLMDHLNHAFIVTDQLLVLILTAEHCQVFDHKRTVYSLTHRLKARLSRLLSTLQYLPFKQASDITVSTFLSHEAHDSDAERAKTLALVRLGFIERYRQREGH